MAAKRTPFGKMGGLLKDLHPSELMAAAAKDAFKAGKVAPGLIDTVNVGIVNTVRSTKDTFWGWIPDSLINLYIRFHTYQDASNADYDFLQLVVFNGPCVSHLCYQILY